MEGMVFDYLRFEEILPIKLQWIVKPLYDCLPCMASFWTIVLLQGIHIKSMLIVCGMNAIIAGVLQFFNSVKLPENE